MKPSTYLPTARLLADRARVVIPAIFELPGRWTFDGALDCLEETIDHLEIEELSLLSHSFGGGLGLGLVERRPERVVECVFSDTLGVRDRFGLATEALHDPFGFLALATRRAASAFAESVIEHPLQLAEAALWAFRSDRGPEISDVVDADIPCHVLWANHDTLLSQSDGREFARRLGATFTVAEDGRVEHDWMFDDPDLFVAHLERLNLRVLQGTRSNRSRGSRA